MGILAVFDDAWHEMLQIVGVSEEDAAPMKAEVLACYGEPERAYHNLGDALRVWQDVMQYASAEGVEDTGAVQMAALLHDVVYDPRRQDNEAQSAEFAINWGRRLVVASPTVERAAEIILATQAHGPAASTEISVVLDADLAILAADWEEYEAYCAAIRQEYGWVPEDEWVTGRGRVLSGFLAREQIYHRPAATGAQEAAARGNITRELSRLENHRKSAV